MPKLLQDKISIIYWAGRATGGALAREGVNAFLASRTQARVEVLAREISATEERSSRRKPLTFPFATALKETSREHHWPRCRLTDPSTQGERHRHLRLYPCLSPQL